MTGKTKLTVGLLGGSMIAALGLWLGGAVGPHGGEHDTADGMRAARNLKPTQKFTRGDDGRIVAHVAPSDRRDGRRTTVADFGRDMHVPGLVSVAGEKPDEQRDVSPELEQQLALNRAAHQLVAAEQFELKTNYRQERRQLRDRSRPRVGRRFGENRQASRDLRRKFRSDKRDVSDLGRQRFREQQARQKSSED